PPLAISPAPSASSLKRPSDFSSSWVASTPRLSLKEPETFGQWDWTFQLTFAWAFAEVMIAGVAATASVPFRTLRRLNLLLRLDMSRFLRCQSIISENVLDPAGKSTDETMARPEGQIRGSGDRCVVRRRIALIPRASHQANSAQRIAPIG